MSEFEETIKISTSDGQEFEMSRSILNVSELVLNMNQDQLQDTVTLTEVTSETFANISIFLNHYAEEKMEPIAKVYYFLNFYIQI